MEENIVLLKLYNGEMLIGKTSLSIGDDNINYILSDPRSVGIIPTMTGSVQIAITSICAPFKVKRLKEEIKIASSQVMFCLTEDEIDNELINGYKSEISGIKIASSADMASLNSSTNNSSNEFII